MWFIKYGLQSNVSVNGLSPHTNCHYLRRPQTTAVRFSVRAEYSSQIKQATALETRDRCVDALFSNIFKERLSYLDYGSSGRSSDYITTGFSQVYGHQAVPISHEISSCQVLCICYICEWPPLNMLSSCYWTPSSFKPHICSSVFTFN